MSELVRKAVAHYDDVLERHLTSTTAATKQLSYPVLRPHFVGREQFDDIMQVTTLLNRGVITAARQLLRDRGLRQQLGIPDYLDRMIALDRERDEPAVLARFDGLVDRRGVFKVIEYNTNPGFSDVLTALFASLPIAEDFGARFGFRTTSLSARITDALRVRDGAGVVAIPVTSLPAERTKYFRPSWADHVETRGVRLIEATIDEFRHDGRTLTIERGESIPVDFLWPVWDDLMAWADTGNEVIAAIRAGSVRMMHGGSLGLVCGYKHLFELLSNPDYASMFEPDVLAALSKHVPWTRAVRNAKTTYNGKLVDLLPFVADSRDRWVLKPSGGTGGTGVLIGKLCTDAIWRQTLKRALTQKYVVQERVLSAVESFPCISADGLGLVLEESTPTFEPFVWNGLAAADALVRISTTGNHSFGDGGNSAALWIIEGEK